MSSILWFRYLHRVLTHHSEFVFSLSPGGVALTAWCIAIPKLDLGRAFLSPLHPPPPRLLAYATRRYLFSIVTSLVFLFCTAVFASFLWLASDHFTVISKTFFLMYITRNRIAPEIFVVSRYFPILSRLSHNLGIFMSP